MERDTYLGPLIKAINIEIQKHINNQMGDAPKGLPRITGPQMQILLYLSDRPDKIIYQSDLQGYFNLSRPTINGLIKRLRTAGLIRVVPVPEDRRYKRIVLSEKMEAEFATRKPVIMQDMMLIENQLTKDMSKADISAFRRLLGQSLNNIKQLDS